MIIPELQFLQVKREAFRGNAVMFHKALLSVAPKSLQAINVDSPTAEMDRVVHLQMPEAAEHEGIIGVKSVGVYDATPPDLRYGEPQQRFSFDVGHCADKDLSVTFQDTEDRDFPTRSPSAPAFASSPEIGLIKFHLPAEEHDTIGSVGHDCQAEDCDRPVSGGIRDSQLRSELTGRDLKFKELEQPEPLAWGQVSGIDPAAAEIVKGIGAVGAAAAPVCQTIEFTAPATGAETLLVFPAKSQQETEGISFRFNQLFIANQVHSTILSLVPDLI